MLALASAIKIISVTKKEHAMNDKTATQLKSGFLVAMLAASITLISSCNDEDEDSTSTSNEPTGLGYEQSVAIPDVSDPLPAITYVERNDGAGRFYRETNPINYALRGINDIWKGTTDTWQTTAGDYTDEVNGYEAGDGPNPHNAANGQASDYVEEGTEIIDSATWEANIQYVINVTTDRTDEDELYAFLDDIRSKSYSTIDGFGSLTEDYAANSGAYAEFEEILVTDVTENTNYKPDNNDSFSTYGGQTDSTLGDMVALASLFRNSNASTSGPKYLFGTPRPWRMTDTGEIDFLEVETLNCVDGSTEGRDEVEVRIDSYTSSVEVIPGLACGRRSHSTSHENAQLYTTTTENRRKDNGYPSGHTNAGVLASLAYAYAMPERFAAHVARGVELGENRVVAGMHSPVDVIGGRIQATMVAVNALIDNPDIAEAAYNQSQTYFGAQATDASMSLYDYVNQEVAEEGSFINDDGTTVNVNVFNNNRFSDHDALKETYEFRLTYGLPQSGDTTLDPIVPEGAEVLLQTRQPYLTDAQRRAVLATTEVESGYPLLDKTNGWGRLNLVAAGDGYGAFDGDVYVTMVASEGGFNALDHWRNDISGAGKLTKAGTGELVLTGENTYSGGTVVKGGILEAAASSAFGSGELYVHGGEVEVTADDTLEIGADYQQVSGTLTIALDDDFTQIDVAGKAVITAGDLILDAGDTALTENTIIKLINADDGISGEFSSVTLEGYEVALTYADNAVYAEITID